MKKVKKFLIFYILIISIQSNLVARLDDVCAHSNQSVVKFRKKIFDGDIAKARKYCVHKELIGASTVYFDWPIDLCEFWISSLFGPRKHKGAVRNHTGIDMAAYAGTQVKSAAPGKVLRVEQDVPGYGTVIDILHKGGKVTRYAHLQETMVKNQQKVGRGEIIGAVGATGNVRGKSDPSHLHFEILNSDHKQVDPLDYLYCSEVAFENSDQ